VRRFRCLNPQCSRQTFAERLPNLPVSARQTSRLGTILESIAVVLSGQAGSRLADQLAMPVSAGTLLRRAKKKTPAPPTPRILGVDDFAFRRGHTYGAILLNLETHQPVDLLQDRSAETFAQWLRQHPGVGIISRDRSKDDQRGATDGAPAASCTLPARQ
jgi:transposase